MDKPLITYVPPQTFMYCYGSYKLPYVNAREPEEICKALWHLSEPQAQERI